MSYENVVYAIIFQDSCTLEFDGASKGNPGLAGAGAVLRADDGSAVCSSTYILDC